MLRFGLAMLALTLVIAGGALAFLNLTFKPASEPGRDVDLTIARGTSSAAIADSLIQAGLLPSRAHFWAARAARFGRRLQAGDYRFRTGQAPIAIIDRLIRGETAFDELSVPEGSNLFEVALAVERLGWVKADAFLAAARDPALIRDLAPEAPSLEGYLFPATYRLPRRSSAEQVCRLLTAEFRRRWAQLNTQANVHETVTLASLIEKETGLPADRARVASVYRNRLRKNMKLDCDPTTIYAALLTGNWRGTIYRSDLDRDHPYNTYRRPGLPPGPIANPSLAALQAALQPADTPFLYFVAKPDGSGGSNFSADYATHQRYVAEYRRGKK
jgi:UPF0755 protein